MIRSSKLLLNPFLGLHSSPVKSILIFLFIVIAYVITAKIGFIFAAYPGNVTAVWIPSGIALSIILIKGNTAWLGIWLGSFLVNEWYYLESASSLYLSHSLVSFFIATGSTLQAIVGALLINKFTSTAYPFDRAADVFKFGCIEMIFCTIAASFGVTCLLLNKFINIESYRHIWFTWWIGDLIGILTVTPVVLVVREKLRTLQDKRVISLIDLIFFSSVILVCLTIFGSQSSISLNHFPVCFLLFPFITLAAFYRGHIGVVITVITVTCCSIYATISGYGPFVLAEVSNSLLLVQAFVGTITITGLTLAASLLERKKIELKLKRSEEIYRSIVQHAPVKIIICDNEGKIVFINHELFGISVADHLDQNICKHVDPAFQQIVQHSINKVFRTEKAVELEFKAKDSINAAAMSYYYARIGPVKFNGITNSAVLFIVDITKRKYAEEMLMTAQAELEHRVVERTRKFMIANESLKNEIIERKKIEETLQRNQHRLKEAEFIAHVGSWEWDIQRNIVTWSDTLFEMFGYKPQSLQITFDKVMESVVPEDVNRVRDAFKKMLQLKIPGMTNGLALEFCINVQDVGKRYLRSECRVFVNSDKAVLRIIGAIQDITDQKHAEEERQLINARVLQSQKLASVGQLATGIAHEINNPISYILTNLNTICKYIKTIKPAIESRVAIEQESVLSADVKNVKTDNVYLNVTDLRKLFKELAEAVEESKEGALLICSIVQNLKEFSHAGSAQLISCDVNKEIEVALKICQNTLKYRAIITKFYGKLPKIYCYSQRLRQVFVNLLMNAVQAFEDGKRGSIIITTQSTEDKGILISIKDSGKGIPKEQIQRLFEPFFTTKSVGKGTGLGLYVVYNIIKQHNGTIEVRSAVGKGTEFIIILPRRSLKEMQVSSVSNESLPK
ncbi:MAG: MASE1 domain-containing protein [Planctomycetes bacterium]|nr:MASE1 domain-containing protein [Planctomycetota bacterium]